MAQRGSWARYTIWGSFAVCAVLGAAVSIAVVVGAHRGMQFALPGMKSTGARTETAQAKTPAPAPVQVTTAPATSTTSHEIARLNDALRALAAERDRLAARVELLERSVGDITASIRQAPEPAAVQTAATPIAEPTPAPRPERIAAAPTEVTPPQAVRTAPRAGAIAAAPATPPVADSSEIFRPYALMQPIVTPPSPAQAPMQIHAVPLTPEPAPRTTEAVPRTSDSTAIRTEFAIDLGGDTSMDGLRALWANLRGNHGATLGNLRPLVSVREGGKSGDMELRLVAGPLVNAGAAARTCAALQAKGVNCQTAVFDGQRLALR
jgi:hypothetical protein